MYSRFLLHLYKRRDIPLVILGTLLNVEKHCQICKPLFLVLIRVVLILEFFFLFPSRLAKHPSRTFSKPQTSNQSSSLLQGVISSPWSFIKKVEGASPSTPFSNTPWNVNDHFYMSNGMMTHIDIHLTHCKRKIIIKK